MVLYKTWSVLGVCLIVGSFFAFVQLAAAQAAPFAPGEFARVVDPSLATGINFTKSFRADFNNDGVLDKVSCSNADHSVKVFDGKKLSNVLYSWEGPASNTLVTDPAKPREISSRSYTGCITAEFAPGRPSIIVSDSFVHPVLGYRIPAEQFVLLNEGTTASGTIKMIVRTVRKADGTIYRAPVRSVKCTPYPDQLVKTGKTPGILCFYAGYDQGWSGGYGDRVALLKLEDSAGTLVTKDLTGSAGLPWKGGMEGTSMSTFRTYRNSSGTTKSDGLSMMGGAWLDYDKDGLADLITVGQHSSVWAFKMAINTAKPEGVAFTKTDIMTASNVSMTEFLTVSAFNEQDARIQLPCVYISGEVENPNALKSYDVPDHARCYENGTWVTHMLPGLAAGKGYSSTMQGASLKIDSVGRILALVPNFIHDKTGAQLPATPATNLFEINPSDTCQVKLDSQLMASDKTTVIKTVTQTVSVAKGTSPYIGGWVDCNATSRNAYFSGVTFVSGTSNITQLGWWTAANYQAHQSTFQAIPYKNSGSFIAAPGTTKSVGLWNGCSKNASKITATVLSCTSNAGPSGSPVPTAASASAGTNDQSGLVLGASTVSDSVLGNILTQIQNALSQLGALITK
jgi:hypothetical protein